MNDNKLAVCMLPAFLLLTAQTVPAARPRVDLTVNGRAVSVQQSDTNNIRTVTVEVAVSRFAGRRRADFAGLTSVILTHMCSTTSATPTLQVCAPNPTLPAQGQPMRVRLGTDNSDPEVPRLIEMSPHSIWSLVELRRAAPSGLERGGMTEPATNHGPTAAAVDSARRNPPPPPSR